MSPLDIQQSERNPTLELLATRRSVKAVDMGNQPLAPGQLETILRAGMRVPDHGKLAPWRFVVFEGEGRGAFGAVLKAAYAQDFPDAAPSSYEFERARFERASAVVAVISAPRLHPKIPVWEQQLSAGAACQNMMIAGSALGLACQWLTEWYAFDARVGDALGVKAPDGEQVAGFLYFGTRQDEPGERDRPDFDQVVSWYGQD